MLPTRIIAINPAAGVDAEDIDPGPRPAPIEPGGNYRIYADGLFARSLEIWHTAGICEAAVRSADAAARRVNEASGQ